MKEEMIFHHSKLFGPFDTLPNFLGNPFRVVVSPWVFRFRPMNEILVRRSYNWHLIRWRCRLKFYTPDERSGMQDTIHILFWCRRFWKKQPFRPESHWLHNLLIAVRANNLSVLTTWHGSCYSIYGTYYWAVRWTICRCEVASRNEDRVRFDNLIQEM